MHCFGLPLRLRSNFFASQHRQWFVTFQVTNVANPLYLLSAFEGNLAASTANLKAQISVAKEAGRTRAFLNSALGAFATQR